MTPSRAERRRHNWVLFGLAALFVALGGRLYYIQVLCHDRYLAAAKSETRTEFDLPAPRGAIADCRGRPLALSVPAYLVVANLPDVPDPEETAGKLAPLLGVPEEELLAKLQKQRQVIFLKRKVPVSTAREIEKAQQAERAQKGPRALAGILLLPDSRRSYVNGKLFSHGLGHTDIDDHGAEGAEHALDALLQGTPGKWAMRRDGRSRTIGILDESYREPIAGNKAVLTIDVDIQQALEEQLETLANKYSPVGAFGVVLDPDTGRVLAMASWPDYDPNNPGACEPAARLNRNISTVLEPGSTFKPFVLAALLEERLAQPTDRFFGENGAWRTGGRTITDAHGYGSLTLAEGVIKSSNIVMAKAGERLGSDGLWRYCRSFGFGRPTGLGLPGECDGLVRPASRWQRESVHSISFGHEINVTPMQLAAGYAALVNGGRLYTPQFVLRIENAKGEKVKDYPPKYMGQVISAQTSATVREILTQVVERGTGKLAGVEEYQVAGKTGTARKLVDGHYSAARHFSSFVGIAPADRPRLVTLITVDEPQGACYGGTVAAPAVGQVLREGLACLGVEPRPKSAVATSGKGK